MNDDASRKLVPVRYGSLELNETQVVSLAAMPLSELNLDKYLQKSPADASITLRDFDADFPLAK